MKKVKYVQKFKKRAYEMWFFIVFVNSSFHSAKMLGKNEGWDGLQIWSSSLDGARSECSFATEMKWVIGGCFNDSSLPFQF